MANWAARPRQILKSTLREATKGPAAELWAGLHDLGLLLALSGRMEEAVEVWSRAGDPRAVRLSTGSAWGDGAIAALSCAAGAADVSRGAPSPQALLNVRHGGDVSMRIAYVDAWARQRLCHDRWDAERLPLPGGPLEKLRGRDLFRRACREAARVDTTWREGKLSWPPQDGADPEHAKRALDLMFDERRDGLPFTLGAGAALLLSADIAARYGDAGEADRRLGLYVRTGRKEKARLSPEDAACLYPLAMRLAEGCLADLFELPDADVAASLEELRSALPALLATPAGRPSPKTRATVLVENGLFFLEPRVADAEAAYFQKEEDHRLGYSSFGTGVAVSTPSDTGRCFLRLRTGTRVPPVDGAAKVVAFPLEVREDADVYVRTVSDAGDEHRLDVPAGRHLIVARFAPHGRPDPEEVLRDWDVTLTLLPPGAAAPGIQHVSA